MSAVNFAALTSACNDAFGQPVTYLPAVGGSYPINGVFDDAYQALALDAEGSQFNTVAPRLGLQPGDLPVTPAQGDQVTIMATGETFTVKDYRPDSHGWAILELGTG